MCIYYNVPVVVGLMFKVAEAIKNRAENIRTEEAIVLLSVSSFHQKYFLLRLFCEAILK